MEGIGRRRVVIAESWLPDQSDQSHGPKPALVSHEPACIVNTGDADDVEIRVLFEDREPVGSYRLTVPARPTIQQQFNDLAEPEPVPPATNYSSVIEADVPVAVQHTRLDSRQSENALTTAIAFPG